jgi:hypothetical protein
MQIIPIGLLYYIKHIHLKCLNLFFIADRRNVSSPALKDFGLSGTLLPAILHGRLIEPFLHRRLPGLEKSHA